MKMISVLFLLVKGFSYLRKIPIWFMYYLLLGIKSKEIARHITFDSVCLDVGAGVGQYTIALRNKGYSKVYPLEPDRKKLVRCDVELAYCSTAQDIPVSDKSFDFAFAINVLHHTSARLAMLVEMNRVSEKVLISEINKDNVLVRIYNRIIGESTKLLNESELRELMILAGTKNVRIYQRSFLGIPNVFMYGVGD